MLGQPEEKGSVLEKKILTKGRQETLDDVITLNGNIIVMRRFWVNMEWGGVKKSYPLIIRLLVKLSNTLSFTEYREFNNKFKKKHLITSCQH